VGKEPFAPTHSSREAFAALDVMRMERKIVVLSGRSGTAKSTIVAAYGRQHPAVVPVLMRQADFLGDMTNRRDKGAGMMLGRIEAALGREYGQPAGPAAYDKVWHLIEKDEWTNCEALIIDEAHFIHARCLHVLRQLAGEVHIGLALVGEETLEAKLRTDPNLAAFRNRVALWHRLGIYRDDVEAYFRHFGLPPSAVERYHKLGQARGWHGIAEAVSKARVLAGGETPSHRQMGEACRFVHDSRTRS
jgi:DNA transposition AAA+ family ATPase